jgi:hypothetical protein
VRKVVVRLMLVRFRFNLDGGCVLSILNLQLEVLTQYNRSDYIPRVHLSVYVVKNKIN